MRSERPDLGSEKPDLGSEKPDLGSERPDLGSEGPDLRSERPALRSERPAWRSERLDLGLRGGCWTLTSDRKNCPVWNHRSSTPPGPLPKKEQKKRGKNDRGTKPSSGERDEIPHMMQRQQRKKTSIREEWQRLKSLHEVKTVEEQNLRRKEKKKKNCWCNSL